MQQSTSSALLSASLPPSSGGSSRGAGSNAPLSRDPESANTAWQLIREDVFEDHIGLDDAELERLVLERAKTSSEPHADLIRLMIGTSLREEQAKAMWTRSLEHRRELSAVLGRAVHVRVAALDLLTLQRSAASSTKSPDAPDDSRPIMVAPSLLERALEEASSDGVTGLPRASHFLNVLQYALEKKRVTVVFIDLDGMKGVNDEHGHARGDDVLRTMADAARAVLRRGDVVARLGGDEFGLMLVDATFEEATTVVDRLRQAFEDLTSDVGTSFSAGIAVASDSSTAEELLGDADRAMYVEKRHRSSRRINPTSKTIPTSR